MCLASFSLYQLGKQSGYWHMTDLVVCTPWLCHWAHSPLDRHGGTFHWACIGLTDIVYMSHCSRMTHTLQDTLQTQKHRSEFYVPVMPGHGWTPHLSLSPRLMWTHCGHTPSVHHCWRSPRGSSQGTSHCEGILLGSLCRSHRRSRRHTPTCTLTETQTHRQRLFKPYKLSCVSCALNIQHVSVCVWVWKCVLMCACLTANTK